jgi:hypothetical protein
MVTLIAEISRMGNRRSIVPIRYRNYTMRASTFKQGICLAIDDERSSRSGIRQPRSCSKHCEYAPLRFVPLAQRSSWQARRLQHANRGRFAAIVHRRWFGKSPTPPSILVHPVAYDAGCTVPHPFAFFANGWEATNLDRPPLNSVFRQVLRTFGKSPTPPSILVYPVAYDAGCRQPVVG